jgi:hypothetical protein
MICVAETLEVMLLKQTLGEKKEVTSRENKNKKKKDRECNGLREEEKQPCLNFKIGMYCLSAKHAALKRKSKCVREG